MVGDARRGAERVHGGVAGPQQEPNYNSARRSDLAFGFLGQEYFE